MIGVILCGGKSTRMGADKGLLKLQANTWAQTAVEKLNSLEIPVKISVSIEQRADYASVFNITDLVCDNISLTIKGPLLGLLSCHIEFPEKDLILLACDMPLMESSILKELNTIYQSHRQFDAFVFTNNNEPEPLCGIYKSTALATILSMYKNQQLSKHSMKFMLENINTYFIPIKDEQKKYFRNFNAHAELNGL